MARVFNLKTMSNAIFLNPHMREIRKYLTQVTNHLFGNVNIHSIETILENNAKYDVLNNRTQITYKVKVKGATGRISEYMFKFYDIDESCYSVKNLYVFYSKELKQINNNNMKMLLTTLEEYLPKQLIENINKKLQE